VDTHTHREWNGDEFVGEFPLISKNIHIFTNFVSRLFLKIECEVWEMEILWIVRVSDVKSHQRIQKRRSDIY
jgi:hypothetical protein